MLLILKIRKQCKYCHRTKYCFLVHYNFLKYPLWPISTIIELLYTLNPIMYKLYY